MDQNNYDTLSEAMNDLREKGYVEDFNLQKDSIRCERLDKNIKPSEFIVDQMFRFEGMTNPSDNSALYAVSCPDENLKGLIADAYGTYADPMNMEMLQKLKYDPRK